MQTFLLDMDLLSFSAIPLESSSSTTLPLMCFAFDQVTPRNQEEKLSQSPVT